MKITELFEAIKNESSTLGKKQLIKDNLSEVLKQIFIDTYDTSKKYYIKNIPELAVHGELTIDEEYDTFHSTLMKLHYRDVTGNDAIEFLVKTLEHYTKEDQEVLINIVQRNLKIGVSIDNFNSVCQVIKTFDVALAENLEKAKNVDPIDGTYFASVKLDGCRCICFVTKTTDENGDSEYDIEFKSRQGKTFTTLDNLRSHVMNLFTMHADGSYVLDGECCMIMADGSESFKGIMKEITRKNHTIENPCYKVFDCLTLAEFNMEVESRIFTERYNELVEDWYCTGTDAKFIDIVFQEQINTQEDFDRWSQKVKDNGWEGFMHNASYFGRIFARVGGLSDAVVQALKEQESTFEAKSYVCDGIENFRLALLKAQSGKADFNFIEGMGCIGGCIGGPCCLNHEVKDKTQVDKYGKMSKEQTIKDSIRILQ